MSMQALDTGFQAPLFAIGCNCEATLWRAVEAQHVVATRALLDSLAEQELLESVLEASKPPVPAPCAGLDYLTHTPFRYPPPSHGSRFRGSRIPVCGTERQSWFLAVDRHRASRVRSGSRTAATHEFLFAP